MALVGRGWGPKNTRGWAGGDGATRPLAAVARAARRVAWQALSMTTRGLPDLAGKVAVVTGAGSGIGRGLARRLGAEGMRLVLADIEPGALATTQAELSARGAVVCTRVTDVADRNASVALADAAWDAYGQVDLLCNNAGVFVGGLLWDCPPSDLDWVLGVNLHGILNGVSAFVPRMLAQGTPGHIVNTASGAGLLASAYSGPYTISKFAAVAASECLAKDLAAVGAPIGVSVLCPGAVATAIARSRRNHPVPGAPPLDEAAAFVEKALSETTAGGVDPDDVAKLVVDAVRTGEFLILTADSYARQLAERADDLVARRLPRSPALD